MWLATKHGFYSVVEKSKIAATPDQREKLGAYHNVWGEMMSMQR